MWKINLTECQQPIAVVVVITEIINWWCGNFHHRRREGWTFNMDFITKSNLLTRLCFSPTLTSTLTHYTTRKRSNSFHGSFIILNKYNNSAFFYRSCAIRSSSLSLTRSPNGGENSEKKCSHHVPWSWPSVTKIV